MEGQTAGGIAGKVAIIAGVSRGIGRAAAVRVAEAGRRYVIESRRQARTATLALDDVFVRAARRPGPSHRRWRATHALRPMDTGATVP
ncbi:MAG: hypothetical protein ACXVDI_02895 [Ktedonobacterales bacterium]